ncbi:MAG: MBL fold metallo-hydrolase, partial [Acutalibacter sp.]|nr:MBL fold metallo-hydrolase [Acutalibacter sp.]
CLIDSGGDKDAGKKIKRVLDSQGWTLTAIYNTHSNADHIGGNGYLQQQTGCQVFAPGIECAFTCHPVLEPAFLYGGFPMKELRHKFLMAQESRARPLDPERLPGGLRAVPLPGHFFHMVGFATRDHVMYLADCLSSRETLEKYKVSFIYDVAAYLDTLEQVKAMKASLFVPSHAPVTEDIGELAQYNMDKTTELGETIAGLCKEPSSFEEVLSKLCGLLDIELNVQQYALVGSTVRSFLSWLKDQGRLTVRFAGGRMLWRMV